MAPKSNAGGAGVLTGSVPARDAGPSSDIGHENPGPGAGKAATVVADRSTVDDSFDVMVRRLNKLSVDIHHDAYTDVSWDAPGWELNRADPRLILTTTDPIGATDWYRSLPPERQAEVGLYRIAACMKIGWHFENFLQRGLLSRAMVEPDGSLAFRYLHHEIIEESQHTLMFQEFANRSGLPVRGMPRRWRWAAEGILWWLVRAAPGVFFVLVLGGEDPADFLQRTMLREGIAHPLIERIMRIHVTEEARHLSFARHFLKRTVPQLGWFRRQVMTVSTPILLGLMTRMMLVPPADMRRHCAMERRVAINAFRSEGGRAYLAGSVAKSRRLCREIGLVPRWAVPLWRAAGIWGDNA